MSSAKSARQPRHRPLKGRPEAVQALPPPLRWLSGPLIAAAAVAVASAGAFFWFSAAPAARHPNVLLITIDTLRADRVGVYDQRQRATTPTLDALAARGVVFEHAQSTVPLTGPSHATILTGRYPPEHGVRSNVTFSLADSETTLAERLETNGYRTAAFVAAYPVAAAFGFGQGFDSFDESFHESGDADLGAERPGNEVADKAAAWLRSRHDAPFFAWVHFYDPHAPYSPPEPFRSRFAGRAYDGEVAFVDAQIARLLDAVNGAGKQDDTIVLVVADHGESLGEHDEQTHAVLVYESSLRVPLIVAGPGVPAGGRAAARAGTIDIVPTLLALLGLGPDAALPGRDLRPAFAGQSLPGQPLYAESLFGRLNCRWSALRVWTRGDWKLIAGAGTELYNLSTDPGERSNLADRDPARVRAMREELMRAVNVMAPAGDRAQANAVPPEQEERLRSLGYVAGTMGAGEIDQEDLPDPRTHVVFYDRLQAASAARGPELPRAFAEIEDIARHDPGNPFAFGTLASMAYRFGSLPVAAGAFQRALELDPDRPGLRQNYGKLLRELERYGDSERELRIAVEQAGMSAVEPRVSLVETLIAAGRTSDARKAFDELGPTAAERADAVIVQARLMAAERGVAAALPLYERAARGNDVETLVELAEAYLAAGDAARALEAADRALSRGSGHPWALAVKARALATTGNVDAARPLLARAMNVRPRRPAVWRSLADGFAAAGDDRSATRCRMEARALSAPAPTAHRSAAALTGSDGPPGSAVSPAPSSAGPRRGRPAPSGS